MFSMKKQKRIAIDMPMPTADYAAWTTMKIAVFQMKAKVQQRFQRKVDKTLK